MHVQCLHTPVHHYCMQQSLNTTSHCHVCRLPIAMRFPFRFMWIACMYLSQATDFLQLFQRDCSRVCFSAMAPVKSSMKKPAAAAAVKPVQSSMKKPASANPAATTKTQNASLTEASLKALEGASDEKVQQFLNKLSDSEQNLLWKKFEQKRKEQGTDQEYKANTSGAGAVQKKNHCLKIYLKTGGTKNSFWRDNMAGLLNKDTYTTTESWLTREEALRKWGAAELQARVRAQTMLVRKDPKDSRFCQFQEVKENHDSSVSKYDDARVSGKGTASAEELMNLHKMRLQGSTAISFGSLLEDGGQDDDASGTEDINKFALTTFKRRGGGSGGSNMSESDAMLKQWETNSALADKAESAPQALDKAKSMALRISNKLELIEVPASDKALKKNKKEFEVAAKALNKLTKKSTAGVIKKAMKETAKYAKALLSSNPEIMDNN